MAEEVRGVVEPIGGAGTDTAAVVRIVGGVSEQPAEAEVLAAVLAAGLAADEASWTGTQAGCRSRSWKQEGRLEAMGTDPERRNGLR